MSGKGESKGADDDDPNRDGDDGGEDIHLRARSLRNFPRVQYFVAVLPKSITTFHEPTLSMALKSPERMHFVNAVREVFNTLFDLGT